MAQSCCLDGVRHILAVVTPGGEKTLRPSIAAAILIWASMGEQAVWVVPRGILRLQGKETFTAPGRRAQLGHALSVCAANNEADLTETGRHRTLLVFDEMHHLPGLADDEPGRGAEAMTAEETWSLAARCFDTEGHAGKDVVL